MRINENDIRLIIKTIGNIRNPKYELVHKSVIRNDSFSGDVSVEDAEEIHKKVQEVGGIDLAVKLLFDSSTTDISTLDSKRADDYIVEKTTRQTELNSLKEMMTTSTEHRSVSGYMVVSEKLIYDISEKVNRKIAEGWEPLGGIGFAALGASPIGGNAYIQSMIKYR